MTVTSAQPRLRWTGEAPVDVQICSDARCAHPVVELAARTGGEATPPAALPPGYYFWRVKLAGTSASSSPTWLFRVRPHAAGYAPAANTAGEPFADYNGDGYPDLVVHASQIGLYLGGPDGLSAERVLTQGASDLIASIAPPGGDLDGDGVTDFMTLFRTPVEGANPRLDAQVVFGRRAGDPTRAPATIAVTDDYPLPTGFPAAIGDYDGDGIGDMAAALRYGGARFRGCVGRPADRAAEILPCQGCREKQFVVGDFDGDGKADFGFGDSTQVGIYRDRQALVSLPDITFALAADVNSDGYTDLLAQPANGTNPPVSLFLGGAQGLTATATTFPSLTTPVADGDFDGDGFTDVAHWSSCGDACQQLVIDYGSAAGWGGRSLAYPATTNSLSVATVDLNADGYDDLLTTDRDRHLAYFPGGPSGLTTTATVTLPL